LCVIAAVKGKILDLLGVDDAGDLSRGGIERLDGAGLNFNDFICLTKRKDKVTPDC
jgi:hypothetical protein